MVILIAFSSGAGLCLGYSTTYQPEGQKLTHLIKNQRQNKEEDGHDSIEIILQVLQICDGCDTFRSRPHLVFLCLKVGGGIGSVASYLFPFILFQLPTCLSLVPVLKKKEKNKPTFLITKEVHFLPLDLEKQCKLINENLSEKIAIFHQKSAQGIFSESKIKIWGSYEWLKLMVDMKIFLEL